MPINELLFDVVGFIILCTTLLLPVSVIEGCTVFGVIICRFGMKVIRFDPPNILCFFLSLGLGDVWGCMGFSGVVVVVVGSGVVGVDFFFDGVVGKAVEP